jgi:outer membrane protein TolC
LALGGIFGIVEIILGGCAGDLGGRETPALADVAIIAAKPPSGPQIATNLPELTGSSTPEDYLAHAVANNPALQAARFRWQAAREQIPQAGALEDPQLTYKYFLGGMGFGGDMEERQEFGLSQELPWPAKLPLRVRLARAEAQMEQRQFEAARWKLRYDVAQAYWEHWYLAAALAATEENLRLMQYLEGVARARYATAAGAHPDALRAQMEVSKLDNEARNLRDLQGPTTARLNAVLNRPADSPLPPPKEVPTAVVRIDEGQLLAWAAQANPELAAMDSEVAGGELRKRLARQEYFPDFMVGVEYMDMAASSGAMGGAEDTWAVMAGINLPIWWGKYAAGVRQAEAMRQASLHQRADKANTLAADVKLAAYGLRDAQRRIDLYRDALLPKARQALQAAQASYRAGTTSLMEVLDLQRSLLEFDLSLHRSQADWWQRLAELEMLVGREVPRTAAKEVRQAEVGTQPAAARGDRTESQ